MAVAQPVDTIVNPANSAQRYILWGNGRIDAVGGAVPAALTGPADNFFTYTDQPRVVALHCTDWATGAGYMLDYKGGIQSVNGSATILSGSGTSWTNSNGLAYVQGREYCDWSWDPSGTGQGIALTRYGKLVPFGGATNPNFTGARWTWPAAKKLAMQWTPSKKAVILDLYGGLHGEFGLSTISSIGTYWKGKDYARDLAVTDWTTPGGYKLDLFGGVHAFGGAASPIGAGQPYRPGADVARTLNVITTSPLQLFEVQSGGQQFEWVSSTPPTVNAGVGTNEVQTVTITGAPTGGTFTLTYSGQTTAAIARNATATTVRTSLEALSNIGVGDVTTTGGPLPATVTVTFTGVLGSQDVPQMTATSSLTGGTTPAVVIATAVPGVDGSPALITTDTTRPTLSWTFSDAQGDSQSYYRVMVFTEAFAAGHTMTDPTVWASSALVDEDGIEPTIRGVDPTVDLANGQYREYVMAKDTAGQSSAWSSWSWTQNVAVPATPTALSATANNITWSVALSVTASAGSATYIRFQCSDDGGTTWGNVRGADAVPLLATTTATDWDAPLGVTRTYRAVAYSTAPAVASVASSTAGATVTNKTYVLRAVDNTALGGRVYVQNPVGWTRLAAVGVFQGVGAEYPVLVSDGIPKARRGTLRLVSLDAATWAMLLALLESDSVLVYRDPRGQVIYFRPSGDWSQAMFGAPGEYSDEVELSVIEVQPPQEA